MFAVLETVAQHEHHRVDRDNCCQRRTFDANLKSKVRLHKADDQKLLELREEVLPEQMEWRSINQEEPEPLKCKEEEEEVSIKQEENDIIAGIVNSEEELDSQFLQLHQSQAEENRKDSGLNRCLRPWVEDESDESSETEDSEDDWKETTEGSTPKTVKHKRASINVNNGNQQHIRQAHPPNINQENKQVCILHEEDEIVAVLINGDEEERAPETLQVHHQSRQNHGQEASWNPARICIKPGTHDETGNSAWTEESEDDWKETGKEPSLRTVKASAGRARPSEAYRIVEELPYDSEDSQYSDSSDEEWLPSKKTLDQCESASEEEGPDVEDVEEESPDEIAAEPGVEAPTGRSVDTPAPPAKAKKKQQKRHTWKVKDSPCEGVLPDFLGEWSLNVQATEPLEFFLHLFPEELIDDITYHTNLYALQKGRENLNATAEEMKAFLGINLVMTFIRYPRRRMYWSSEQGLRLPLIADAMAVNRFEDILRYLHFTDTSSTDPGNDKLFRIKPVLDTLQANFLSAVDPEEFQAIDEMIMPFKGKLSIKQYIPKKPKPWGVKIWARAGASGYMYRFEVYRGAASTGAVSELGTAADVILRLCDDIQFKNHKVFFDNFFCGIPLITILKEQGIYGTGTCRVNRLQGAQAKLKSATELKEEGRGAISVVTNGEDVTVTRWLDNSLIHKASSCLGKHPTDVAQRWSKKDKKIITIDKPFAVKVYNDYMGGVGLMDQMVAMYPHRRKNKRWYIRMFFHFLDVTVVNAWHLLRFSGLEQDGLLPFKASLACSLINSGTVRKRGRPTSPPPLPVKRKPVSKVTREVRLGPGNHWPQLNDIKNAQRCQDPACTRKTKYSCMCCNVAVCPGCMANFHTRS